MQLLVDHCSSMRQALNSVPSTTCTKTETYKSNHILWLRKGTWTSVHEPGSYLFAEIGPHSVTRAGLELDLPVSACLVL